MSEWREYELSEMVSIIKETYSPSAGDNIPYIGLEHIEQQSLRLLATGSSNSITSQKFKFKSGDILFGKLRPYFRKVVRPNFDGVCSTDVWVMRATPKFDQGFIRYFVSTHDFIERCNVGETGTRMPRADWTFLKATRWHIPTLTEQKKIANVLSDLDDKIDLLHQQNRTLEQMAETLYRQSFVEGVRDDWQIVPSADRIRLVGGGTPTTSHNNYWNGSIKWLSAKDITAAHRQFVSQTEKGITELGLQNSSTRLLPKYATVISARGTVGKYCILSEPMCFSQSNYGILPVDGTSYFYTYLLVADIVEALQASSYGTVFDTITTRTFGEVQVPQPPAQLVRRFEEQVSPFFEKMLLNAQQILNLQSTRETLLPKLMSGEVRVEPVACSNLELNIRKSSQHIYETTTS